jgi:hypothetical protein
VQAQRVEGEAAHPQRAWRDAAQGEAMGH